MQFNIQNYEVETIIFAHVLPVSREYTIIVSSAISFLFHHIFHIMLGISFLC